MIARAGGFLAIAMAYRLGVAPRRPAGGRDRGGLAAARRRVRAQLLARQLRGLLVALCLWAVERHLDGRRADAFLLGFAAALLRPEVWPFFGLYGLWLAWIEPRRPRCSCSASSRPTASLWFAPEYWGSGDWLRAANRAHQPNPDSAAFADRPFLEVFRRSSAILSVPVLLGRARRARPAAARAAVGRAAARCSPPPPSLMIVVGADDGGAASPATCATSRCRPRSLCVLAGVGWVELVRAARRALRPRAAAALAVVRSWPPRRRSCSPTSTSCATARSGPRSEADFYDTLPVAIAKAGGARRGQALRKVYTGPFQVQAVAWHLRRTAARSGSTPSRRAS